MNARLSGDPAAPRKRNPEISPQVEEIVLHAMARDPKERFQTALAFKQELDNPEAVAVTGRADRLVEPVAWKGGWTRLRWYVAAVALPVVIFLAFFLMKHLQWK